MRSLPVATPATSAVHPGDFLPALDSSVLASCGRGPSGHKCLAGESPGKRPYEDTCSPVPGEGVRLGLRSQPPRTPELGVRGGCEPGWLREGRSRERETAMGRAWIHRALSSAGGPGPGALAAGPGPGGLSHGVHGSLLGAGGGSPCHLGAQESRAECQALAQGLSQVHVSLSFLIGEMPRTVQHLRVDVGLLQGNRPHRMSAHGLRDVSKELSPVALEAASPGEPAVETPARRPAGSIPRKNQSYFPSRDGEETRVPAPGRQAGEEQPFLRGVSATWFCSGPLAGMAVCSAYRIPV